MEAYCETCEETVEVEAVDDGAEADMVFCLRCGEEFVKMDPALAKYKHFVVAKVVSVDAVPKKDLKKVKLDVGKGEDEGELVQVVTNAKHVNVGTKVVVAMVGAVVPAGAVVGEEDDALEIKKTSVGGVKSEGMLCDSPTLRWAGGAKGVIQVLPDSFELGSVPPAERPRND
mmetsp:Transcript_3410/g.4927  ORF Transcript_3410/g.4927 Transcript_3410/m.4927 type:complete len:172 (+) Transcript_3410:75-590(+)